MAHPIFFMHKTSLEYKMLVAQVFLLSSKYREALYLEVEMQKNYHFSVARLKERMPYVVVEDVDFVTTN